MSEERLQEIKDSIEFQYTLAKAKGYDNALLFTNEEEELVEEIERLNNIINECAEDILKELEENHHLSYGVALAIRQKLLDYKELKGDGSNE